MKYSTPEIEVLELDNVDVIQTSGETPGDGDDRLPWG